MNPRSYSAYVPWRKLLEQLRLRVPPPRLPATTACPFCQQTSLRILADPASNSHWAACQRCAWGGDLVELAAAVWQLPIPATILKLTRLGYPFPPDDLPVEAVANYVRSHVETHRRVRAMWSTARAGRIHHSSNLAPLLQELGLTSRLTEERWRQGPGQLLGCLTKADVEECFCPKSAFQGGARLQALDIAHNPSRGRVFSGRNWRDVLAWPYYDLPGRVRGFMFAGRDGKSADDWVFRVSTHQAPRACKEAGLCFHPDLLEQPAEEPLVAVRDVLLATRLQLAHFQRALSPLPLVAWYADDKHMTRQGWSIFAERPLVFFSERLDADLLCQLRITEGKLFLGPETATSREPRLLVARAIRLARPWPEVFATWLEAATPAQLEELSLRMELRGQSLNEYLERCPDALRNRTRVALEDAGRCPQVQIDGRLVEERADGWHLVRRSSNQGPQVNDEIVDAVLRVDRVLHDPRRRRVLYQGRVLFRGRVIDYLVPQGVLERAPFHWMRQLLVEEQAGLLRFSPLWQRHALHIALQFHEPQILTGPDRLGWDPRQDKFVLPRFSLDLTGKTLPSYLPNLDGYPGAVLPVPDAISPAEIGFLTQDPQYDHTSFWGFTALMVARVLAPVLAIRRTPAVLWGQAARAAGNALASLTGCEDRKLGSGRQNFSNLELDEQDNWVTWLNGKEGVESRLTGWIAGNPESGGYLTALGRPAALAASLHARATLLACRDEVWHPQFSELAPRLVSDYLADAFQRKIQLAPEVTAAWDRQVLEDLARFVARRGGAAEAVLAAAADLFGISHEERAAALGELLSSCRRSGAIEVVPEGFVTAAPSLEHLPRGRLRISRRAAYQACHEFGLPTLEADDVQRILDAAGLLKGEDDLGWIVPAAWWKACCREQTKESLKLHEAAS